MKDKNSLWQIILAWAVIELLKQGNGFSVQTFGGRQMKMNEESHKSLGAELEPSVAASGPNSQLFLIQRVTSQTAEETPFHFNTAPGPCF